MHCMRYVMAVATVVHSVCVLAAPPAARQVKSAAELVELCSVTADDPSYAAAMGFCMGYIDGALDYHAALTSGARFPAIVCPHSAVTREELVTVFLDWYRTSAEQGGAGLPVEFVMRAIYEKWPCYGR